MKGAAKLMALGGGILTVLATSEALAAESGGNWRPTYDLIMMWLNFGILAFVAVKFGKAPIMNFLKGRKIEVEMQIKEIEDEKEKATTKISENRRLLDESSDRLAKLKERIVQQGQRKKAEIIEAARQQSENMLEESKRRVESHILHARDALRAEMIDAAVDLALQKLPDQVTEEDNSKLLESYLASTATK